jgi:phosphoenolpyruvate carboxylase
VAAYELVEQIRKLSVAFRRDADHEADKALKKLLKGLSGDQTVSVIRAFTYFSHLANLAEDRHHIRRRIHERAGDTQEGSIEVALARLRWAGIAPKAVVQTLAAAYVSPGADRPPDRSAAQEHPGRRARHCRAADRARRGCHRAPRRATRCAPRELAPTKRRCARVVQLWQTRLLRFTKLTVADEIENALSYYEATFLREIPKHLRRRWSASWASPHLASFLRMGQWIGGDRDGNPNVSAQTLEYALRARPKWRCATT